MRLRSDIWVSAYLRRCDIAGARPVLRRRGGAEAGAIMIRVDCLDGRAALYGPAPQTAYDEAGPDRRFTRLHDGEAIDSGLAEKKLAAEIRFDPDVWIVEIEDRAGRPFLLDDETA